MTDTEQQIRRGLRKAELALERGESLTEVRSGLLLALAAIEGGKVRPVKVVEEPTAAEARRR